MLKNLIALSILFIISNPVLAQQSLLDSTDQTLQNGQAVVDTINTTPNALQQQTQDAIANSLLQSSSPQLQKGLSTTQQIQDTIGNTTSSQAADAVKTKAVQKTADEIIDLTH